MVDVKWAARYNSSSLTRLLQPRVRDHGHPCLTPLAGGIVIGQQGGCAPLTNGINSLVRGLLMVTTTVLPWRAVSDANVQPPARNARLTTQMRQPPARKNKLDTTDSITAGGKTTCPLDGYEVLHDVFKENAHRGTERSLSTCVSSSDMMVQAPAHWSTRLDFSVFKSEPGRYPHRAGSETRVINEVDRAGPGSGSQTVTSFFTRKPTRPTTVLLWNTCVSWIGRNDMKLFKITQKTLVEPWARPPVLLPALRKASHSPSGHIHPAVASTFKNYKSHCFSNSKSAPRLASGRPRLSAERCPVLLRFAAPFSAPRPRVCAAGNNC